jgi:hypothetical protein
MNREIRDNLIKAIEAWDTPETEANFHPGMALITLAKDLKGRDKPIQLSYADIEALDGSIQRQIDVKIDQQRQQNGGKPAVETPEITALQKIGFLFGQALDNGVLVTQDTARGRIAGA